MPPREKDLVVDPVPAPPAFESVEVKDSQTARNEDVEDSTQDEVH
jgi:hypothetical protein